MPITIGYKFGDVVLVPFPFTDQTAAKKRPAVVISSDTYHRYRLLRPSLIKPVLATLERGLILRKLGELQDQDRDALRAALQQILG